MPFNSLASNTLAGHSIARPLGTGRQEGATWQDVTPPVGWDWVLPFTPQYLGGQFQVKAGWAIDANRPTGKAYYVATNGVDTNDGLTPGTALRKIITAYNKADVVEIRVAAGVYGLTNGVGASTLAKNISIIAEGGRVVVGAFAEPGTLAFALDGTLTHTYKVTRSGVGAVWDAAHLDAYGDYAPLTLQANAAAVEANPGSWYLDGTNVLWVRLSDDRVPDINLRVYFNNVNRSMYFAGALTAYLENIDVEGGWGNGALQVTMTAGPNVPTLYAKNCTFKYCGNSNGVSLSGGSCYFQGCTAAKNADDGFNYHAGGGVLSYAVEIDCVGRDNGTTGNTIDNGSTMHDGGKIIRINGEYMRSVGRPIHDIGIGTLSWNLGCYSHHSNAAPQLANFGCGTGATDTTKMWLDTCRSDGGPIDIEVVVGCTVYTCNFSGAGINTGAGMIEAYDSTANGH
jgi:hypothetical protein